MKNLKLLATLLVFSVGAVCAQEDKDFTIEELAAYAQANKADFGGYLHYAARGTDQLFCIKQAESSAVKKIQALEKYLYTSFSEQIKHLEESVTEQCPADIMTTSWAKIRKDVTEGQHGSVVFDDASTATLEDDQLKEVSWDCRNKLLYIIWAERRRADSAHDYEVYRKIASEAHKLNRKMSEAKTNA